MTYPLLEKAPKDHDSEEFLQFLREHNEIIYDGVYWLIIANCKYDKPERRWYTAFLKRENYNPLAPLVGLFGDWEWLKKPAGKNSVRRFHIHLIQPTV